MIIKTFVKDTYLEVYDNITYSCTIIALEIVLLLCSHCYLPNCHYVTMTTGSISSLIGITQSFNSPVYNLHTTRKR